MKLGLGSPCLYDEEEEEEEEEEMKVERATLWSKATVSFKHQVWV